MSESEKDFIIRDENSMFWRRVLCINNVKPKTCFIILITILLVITSLLTVFGVLTVQYITSSQQPPQLAIQLPLTSSNRAKRSLDDNKISQFSSENTISKREAVESEEEDIDKVLSANFGEVNKNFLINDDDEDRNLYKRSNYLRNSIQELENTLQKSVNFAKSITNKPVDRETANLIEKDIRDAEVEINGLDDDIVSLLEVADLTDKSARKRVRHKRSLSTFDDIADPLPSAYSHYAPILEEKKREKRLIQQKLTQVRDEFIRCKKSVGNEKTGDDCERVYSRVIDRFKQITQKFKEIESIVGEMEVFSKPKRKSDEMSSEEFKKDKKKKKKKENKKDSSEEADHHHSTTDNSSSMSPQNADFNSSSTKDFTEENTSTTTTEFSSISSQSEVTTTEASSTSATTSTTSESSEVIILPEGADIKSLIGQLDNKDPNFEPQHSEKRNLIGHLDRKEIIVQPENLHDEETTTISNKMKNSAHEKTREADAACPASHLRPQPPVRNFINNHGFVPEFNLGSKFHHDDHVIREAEVKANPIIKILDTIADRIEDDLENQIDLSPTKKKEPESAESTEIAAAPRETFTSLCENLSKTSTKQAAPQPPQDNQNFAPIQFTNPHFLPPTGEVKGSSKVVMNAGYSGIMPYPICFVQQQYPQYRQTPMPIYPMYYVQPLPFPTQPQSGGNAQQIDPRSHGYFMTAGGRPQVMGVLNYRENPEASNDPSYCTFVAKNDANLPAYFEQTTPKPKTFSDESSRSDRNSYNIPTQFDIIYATYPNQIFAMNQSMQHHHCGEGKLPCFSTNQCISKSKWCDSKVDCVDASDETACSCKARLDESRICDGFIDCPMGSDELGCFGCDKFQYSCYSSREEFEQNGESSVSMCYSSTEKCDGFNHCRNGKDEIECSMIVKNSPSATTSYLVSHSEGVLHRNYKGRWYPVCKNAAKWAFEACEAEVGSLNEQPQLIIKSAQISGLFIQPSMNPQNQPVDYQPLITEFCKLEKGTAEGENQLVLVKCPKPQCGRTKVKGVSVRAKRQTEVTVDQKDDELKESRIVGGSDALPAEFPFIVAIFKDGHFHCGGTIYNEHWIITAAHCTRAFENHHYEVRAGILRRLSHSPTAHITKVTHVIRHEDYERSTMKNDIALMRVKHHFSFNRWIRPICLPTKDRTGIDDWMFGPKAGTICSTLGWGAIRERGASPDGLKVVEVPILSKCKYLNDQEGESICAGEKVGLKDACQGDSGGPLVCKSFGDPSEWYLTGIVSHGEGCARANEPGVYTRTALYLNWIAENVEKPLPSLFPIQACPGMTCVWGAQKCIPKASQCNGVVDCLGGEDEINCPLDIFDLMVSEIHKDSNKTSSIDPNKIQENFKGINKKVFKKALNEVFRCTKISQVINKSQRCDRVVDCEDGSDERNCTCKDHLKGNFAKLICDGHVDCADSTDEIDCMICKQNEFLCPQSKTCIEKSKHCDGEPDCLFKEDELECMALTDGKSIILDINEKPFMHRKGIVTRNIQSHWKIFCDHDGDLRQNTAQIAEDICNVIGFHSAKSHKLVDLASSNIKINNIDISRNNSMIRSVNVVEKTEDEKCLALELECSSTPSSSFAIHPMHQFKIKKNMTTPSAPEIHHIADLDSKDPTKISFKTINPNVWDHLRDFDWPWNAEIFVDGEIISNGILLENSWILAEKSLLSSIENKNNHVTAMLGNARSQLHIRSPYEQISRIDCDHKIENSNAVLLHLEKQIHFNRHVMPSFMLHPNETDKDTRCIAIALSSQKITKTLELKMIPNCQNDVHLTCYQVASNKSSLCTDSDTSHRVATIMCKKKDSAWYPKAFHRLNKGFCDFNEPVSVFALDKSEIYNQIQPILDSPCLKCSTHNFPNATCETHRCPIGKCLRSDHVCDGIEDCRDGSDETEKTCSKMKERKNCARHEFRCKNGKCVDKKAFCDHKKDCEDGSDEPNECTCFDFLRLTEPSKLCDGVTHCWDRSDENAIFCGNNCDGKFKCDGSIFCIPYEQVCDQRNDCPNGNDEKHCLGLFETSNGFGEVAERFLGLWHTKCFPKSRPPTQEDVEVLCKDLGFKNSQDSQAIVKGNLEGLNVISTPHLQFVSMELPPINATKVVPFSKFSPAALNDGFTIHIKSGKSLGKIVAWEKEDHENCLRIEIKCN